MNKVPFIGTQRTCAWQDGRWLSYNNTIHFRKSRAAIGFFNPFITCGQRAKATETAKQKAENRSQQEQGTINYKLCTAY